MRSFKSGLAKVFSIEHLSAFIMEAVVMHKKRRANKTMQEDKLQKGDTSNAKDTRSRQIAKKNALVDGMGGIDGRR